MKNIMVALSSLVFCGAVLASEADATNKRITLTISPLHLFAPMVEINGEFKASDNLGIALIAGFGNIQSSLGGDTYAVREYGIQVNYYSGSNFNQGVQYGVELMKINIERDSSSSIKSSGSGVAFGPYVGYKQMMSSGLTFVYQLGYQSINITAEAHDDNGNSISAVGEGGGLLLNLNVGFSF